ncbi:MAG: FAD-dependent oxidoreductase [Gammaproteobacteria bacterium]|nr:FAD-dependent oxidoreductase [Gammaproteobacteria bacterium]
MAKPHVVILGAGPAGVGAAFQLTRRARAAQVTVLERNPWVGGNAGSFELAGMRMDYGSHRLHPACNPEVLHDIRNLLDGDLLDRPRHGRIRLRGRWIHFPLKPLDLVFKLPPSFVMGVATDLIAKLPKRSGSPTATTFASVLEAGLGRTICRDFYFPYARKVWGLEPEELSATQARRRVSANSLGKMLRKVLSAIPGLKPQGSGRFFYPRQGYGQISEAYYRAAREAGAEVHLNSRVLSVETERGAVTMIRYEKDGQVLSLRPNHVWSTIPITSLARCLKPGPPQERLHAAENMRYRAMILIYLVLEQDRFSEYDAHYFPESEIPISRLSEPKNYSNGHGPSDRTVLCAELPCDPESPAWGKSDEELGQLVCDSLNAAGIPVQRLAEVATRRLRQAYPIYRQGYEVHFNQLDHWLSEIDGLLSFGRQGLFAHDNTHHALYMAYCAVDCLGENGGFDRQRWQAFRRVFDTHVVED